MKYISLNEQGKAIGVFNCPQPDAIDDSGIVCPGTPTIEVADDDPRVVAYNDELASVSTQPLSMKNLIEKLEIYSDYLFLQKHHFYLL
jgi:hypothetical protein